jgi:hypothetical protein
MLSDDEQFLFDNQGYLHVPRALPSSEVAAYLRLVEDNRDRDVNELNEDQSYLSHQLNRPLSRMIDADVRFAALLDHPAVEPYLVTFREKTIGILTTTCTLPIPATREGTCIAGCKRTRLGMS